MADIMQTPACLVSWALAVAVSMGFAAGPSSPAANAQERVAAGARLTLGDSRFEAELDRDCSQIERIKPGVLRFSVERRSRDACRRASNAIGARAEMTNGPDSVAFGDDLWVSFSRRIVALPQRSGQQWVVLGQLHGPNRSRLPKGSGLLSPPFAMSYANGQMRYLIRWGTADTRRARTIVARTERDIGIGEWQDFVLQMRTGDRDSGRVRVWKDGRLIVDHRGRVGYRAGNARHYWKFGVYQGGDPGAPDVVEFANMRVSRQSLIAKVDSPDPL